MMKRTLFFVCACLGSFTGLSQTNVALAAKADHQVGGATTYGPQNYNDTLITASPGTTPWGWTTTNGWIEYSWSTPQKDITKIKFWKGDRPMGSCEIQYWDGTAYVTILTYVTPTFLPVDSVMLPMPVTTTKLKFDKIAGSTNPNHREIQVFAGPPCPSPTNLTISNVMITTATLNWKGVTGALGYEYFVDENPDPVWPFKSTFTTATSVNVNGLKPNTKYYLHVLTKCSATNFWRWENQSFVTLPACKPSGGFHITNLSTVSATINWNVWPSALSYDYVVDQTRTDPTSSTGIKNILTPGENVTGLKENTWYYVHKRARCMEGEISSWSLDSFLTATPCRPPVVKIDHINADEAVAYWEAVPTALAYEYAITTSPTPPVLGTKYPATSLHTPALHDGKEYYVHVRSQCNSQGVVSKSDWATTSFKTFPVGVDDIDRHNVNVSIFPNPTRGNITLSVDNLPSGSRIEITDLSGRVLLREQLFNDRNVINTERLAPGMYLLKYEGNDYSQVFKFVKE